MTATPAEKPCATRSGELLQLDEPRKALAGMLPRPEIHYDRLGTDRRGGGKRPPTSSQSCSATPSAHVDPPAGTSALSDCARRNFARGPHEHECFPFSSEAALAIHAGLLPFVPQGTRVLLPNQTQLPGTEG